MDNDRIRDRKEILTLQCLVLRIQGLIEEYIKNHCEQLHQESVERLKASE